jgi:hypothetical protein
MSAQKNPPTKTKPSYFYIYREVFPDAIFVDNQDYQVFIEFLKNYLTQADSQGTTKTFTIRGRTFQGTPRQPTNFFNQVELLAYKLEPNRFDLLIKQVIPGSLKKFVRAISTRYAIYFNKRYHRSGALFKDPYKSQQIKNPLSLPHLTRNLHSNFSDKEGVAAHHYSSYPEYLGHRETVWINLQDVLSTKGVSIHSFEENDKKTQLRIPEMFLATVILVLLSSYSASKIETSTTNLISPVPSPLPQVSGVRKAISGLPLNHNPSKSEVKAILIIKTPDGSKTLSLYKEPEVKSEIIGQVQSGNRFKLVSIHSHWYEIALNENQNAFVPAQYAQIVREGQ